MPYIAHTPESLLPRSDSKNPATTCKGITSSGRPCRRSIGSPTTSPRTAHGVVAVVSDNDQDTTAAAFFCWQHKDQAEQFANKADGTRTNLVPVGKRSSIDTLINRIGVLHLGDAEGDNNNGYGEKGKRRLKDSGHAAHTKQEHMPRSWDSVRSPVSSVAEKAAILTKPSRRPLEALPRRRPQRTKRPSFFAALCCMSGHDDDDYVEVVRHKRRTQGASRPEMSFVQDNSAALAPAALIVPTPSAVSAQHPSSRTSGYPQAPAPARPTQSLAGPARSHKDPYSAFETSNLLSLIPTNIAPATAASLLAELSKPASPHDEEGYIYIYWLTPDSASGPPSPEAASSLLTPSSPPRPSASNRRRPAQVLQAYAGDPSDSPSEREGDHSKPGDAKKPILLKIGRASNVHRRMSEWTRQCGHDLTLLRWYPHIPSSAASPATTPSSHSPSSRPDPSGTFSPPDSPSSNTLVRKVPHVHRVERLIHLELADKRVRRSCSACGKEHREWFEVEGTRKAIGAVDEVVRRWVGWSETMNDT